MRTGEGRWAAGGLVMLAMTWCVVAFCASETVPSQPLELGSAHLRMMKSGPPYVAVARPPALPLHDAVVKLARLAREDWYNEEVTCVRKSPDQRYAVIGGYLRRTFLLGRMPRRLFGSRVHVVDTAARREVIALETAPVAERTREEKGGSRILDCMFVGNSSYLAAVTNSKLFLWDVRHGRVLDQVYFDRALEHARLEFGLQGQEYFLGVISGKVRRVYQVVPD